MDSGGGSGGGRGRYARPTEIRSLGNSLDSSYDGNDIFITVENFRFRLRPYVNRRWRNFRTDRRAFQVTLVGRGEDADPLMAAMAANRALDGLFLRVLREIRTLHTRSGRSPNALAVMSVGNDELGYVVNSDMGYLSDDRLALDLIEAVKLVLSSKQELSVDDGFFLDITIVDDDTRPDLFFVAGANWDFERPAKWKLTGFDSKRYVYLMPVMREAQHRYHDCCLLMAITFCMVHNKAQRDLQQFGTEHDYKKIVAISHEGTSPRSKSRKAKALEHLISTMDTMVSELDLDIEVFRNCQVPGGDLQREVEKLGINLVVYKDSASFRPIFHWPREHQDGLETVHVLLVSFFENIHHAAAITRPHTFFSGYSLRTTYCQYCRKNFSPRYSNQHKCKNREFCGGCKRIVKKPDMYTDNLVERTYCTPKLWESLSCMRCRKTFSSFACHRAHNKFCRNDTRFCSICKTVYRKGRLVVHRCGFKWCRTCKTYFRRDDTVEDSGHHCQMPRPSPSTTFERMAFFDFETVAEGEEEQHRINAAGVTWEEERGVFREVCFYDTDLQHPQDSVVSQDEYRFQYWCEGDDDNLPPLRWKPKKPKRLDRYEYLTTQEMEDEDPLPNNQLGSAFFEEAEAEEDEAEEEEEENAEGAFLENCLEIPFNRLEARLENDDHFQPSAPGTAVAQFVDFILNKKFYNYVFIAHNSAKFDSILLLKELMSRNVEVKPLYDGNTLYQLVIESLKLRFIDSYRYIKMPLAKFPQRFPSIEHEEAGLAKGTFPFRFNKPENYDYCGEFPDKEYFVDEFATAKGVADYERFRDSWDPEQPYSFKVELHKYLLSDVRLLRAGCLRLCREIFDLQKELNQNPAVACRNHKDNLPYPHSYFHPFTKYFTISSLVHALFLHFEVEEDTVFLLSNQRNGRTSSRKERVWLDYLISRGYRIKTGWNQVGGQKRICQRYYPDGMTTDSKGNPLVVYEFLGCSIHYHAGVVEGADCPYTSKFHPSDKAPFHDNLEAAARETVDKLETYKRKGLTTVTMFECEFDKLLEEDEAFARFASEVEYPKERLRLRTALRGGRVETIRMLYNGSEEPGRRMFYIDKNSLYPHMAITKQFPVGKPRRCIGPQLDGLEISAEDGFVLDGQPLVGLVQATVLPPPSLMIPVLPMVSNDKLKFGLCQTCMDTMHNGTCPHPDKLRALTNTWTTLEILFAVSCGYKVVKVHEIFAYEEERPIFENFFIKMARQKLESEGFDREDLSEEEKREHVRKLNEAMPGLDLDHRMVEKNMGRRNFAKELSNVSLGKFSQNDLKSNVFYIYSFEEFLKLRHRSPNLVVKKLTPLTENMAEVVCELNDQVTGYHANTNVVIYSFITAYARCSMVEDMRQLMSWGARIFYTDTDSIIFDVPDDPPLLEKISKHFNIGSKAYGAYKHETSSPIVTYASLGAKNYSYTTECGETQVKSRGFALSSLRAKEIINHTVMLEMLEKYLDGEKAEVVCPNFRMKVDRKKATVRNSQVNKRYSNSVFDKRIVMSPRNGHGRSRTACTLPFGLKHYDFADCSRGDVFDHQ